jgi:hypothetical protein
MKEKHMPVGAGDPSSGRCATPFSRKGLQGSDDRDQGSGKVSSGYAAGVKETPCGFSIAFSFFPPEGRFLS